METHNVIRISALPFNLQLFAGEKTEPATEKRREDARESGNVPKSQDLESVLVLLASFLVLKFYGAQMFGILGDFMRYTLQQSLSLQLDLPTVISMGGATTIVVLKTVAPIFLVIVLTAVAANMAQVGVMFTTDPLVPDLNRINPINGFENLFSWKSIGELVKSIIKVVIASYVPYSTLTEQMPFLMRFIQMDPVPSMIFLFQIIFSIAIKILLFLLVLSVADWFFQVWRYEESLKMSKEEIKEEYKQREGDPKVKAKIRERQRKMSQQRMMSEVPKASVVVTNPTHLAIALFYDDSGGSAPKVIAMGAGLIAQRIKEIAREHGVPVLENKPLAQALFKMVDVGDVIPQDLYEAVAVILAQVYKLKGKTA